MELKPASLFENSSEDVLKRTIESIEDSVLDVESKLDLILFLLDKKQGVQLGGFKIVNSDDERRIFTEKFTQELSVILKFFNTIGLQYKIVRKLSEDNSRLGFSVLASKDKNILDKFVKADKDQDDRTFGLIVGYPTTAVETYHTDKQFRFRKELPPSELEKLRAEGTASFFSFTPSKEHWAEELEFVREEQKLIKEKAPKLYEEVIQELK